MQRLAGRGGQRLGGHQADDQPADQAGPGRGGDGVDIGQRDAGIGKRCLDDAVQRLDMGARGDLGHDAAKGGMLLDLAEHDVRQDLRRGRSSSSATTDAAVSSQLVSMPSTLIICRARSMIAGPSFPD